MNSLSPISTCPLPSDGPPLDQDIKRFLPVAVENQNADPGRGHNPVHRLSNRHKASLDRAIKQVIGGAYCKTVAADPGIKDDISLKNLRKMHIASLQTGAAGADLLKGENCQDIACRHEISDGTLLRVIQEFSVNIYGKQAILNGDSSAAVIKKYGITDVDLCKELSNFKNTHNVRHARPDDRPVLSLDAAVLRGFDLAKRKQ